MRARAGDGSWKLIGGYNPQSWDSSNGAHYTADPRDWTAFIFNLSDDVLWRQSGPVQTYNRYFDGPTFGAMPLGPDLGVTADLSQVFSLGGWSYGGAANSRTLHRRRHAGRAEYGIGRTGGVQSPTAHTRG